METRESNREKEMREQDARIGEALSRIKHKYLVMSGKGGVGKTTVSINLALLLAHKGSNVGLMDVDFHGPNTLKMLGLEGIPMQSDGERIVPLEYNARLKVISIASMLESPDSAVIWRGPLKIGVIRQFIADVDWGELDYLIIDSPPGTGDEPLTVAQTIRGALGIIVTTPQEISLMDIRKSITFCRQVSLPIAGILENMSGLICPHCGKRIDLFKSGGGRRTSEDFGLPFLGEIPFDPELLVTGDEGVPYILQQSDTSAARAFNRFVGLLLGS